MTDTEYALWLDYKKDPSTENKNKLFDHYYYIAHRVAGSAAKESSGCFDEMLSLTSMKLLTSIDKGKVNNQKAPVRAYLWKVLRCEILDYYRNDAKYRESFVVSSEIPEQCSDPLEIGDKFHDMIRPLDEILRKVAIMRYFKGMYIAEIAKELNVSKATIHVRMNKIHRRLRCFLAA